jgi:hypothetical protein
VWEDVFDVGDGGVSRRAMIFLALAVAVFISAIAWAVSGIGGKSALPGLAVLGPSAVTVVPSGVGSGAAGSPSLSPTPSPSADPAPPSASPSHAKPTARKTTPAVPKTARLVAPFTIVSRHSDQYQGRYVITNKGTAASSSWTMVVAFSAGGSIAVQNADVRTGNGHTATLTNKSSNGVIQPGSSVEVDITIWWNRDAAEPLPVSCTINGSTC